MGDALFHAILDPQNIEGLVLFLVPGFVAFKLDQQLRPQVVRSALDAILEIIAYSIVNDLLWSPVFRIPDSHGFPTTLGSWLLTIVVVIISPAILTILYTKLVDMLASQGIVPSPVSKPWDHFFHRVVKEQQPNAEVGVIITLRDGRRIGGVYKYPGFASSYPSEEQLLLGETWLLDASGGFVEGVNGSMGLLIDKADILTLEFFKWPLPTPPEGAKE